MILLESTIIKIDTFLSNRQELQKNQEDFHISFRRNQISFFCT